MLEARNLVKHFDGLAAIDGVDLALRVGEIRCLIGPNGAGKTTLLNLLTGELAPSSGEVTLEGRRIDRLPVHAVARLGLIRKFQVPTVFESLSALDNLRIAADGATSLPRLFRKRPSIEARLFDLLAQIGLADLSTTRASRLSHGQMQWLEIGMALVNEPKVLLLDEPTAGMSQRETKATVDVLRNVVRTRALTTLIVEHDVEFVRMIGDIVTVLHKGRVLAEGSVAEIERDAEVRRVYLGGEM